MSLVESPITTELLVAGAVGISEVIGDGTDVYWAESRPDEGGRSAIVRWRDGDIDEVTATDVNVRTRVHEYGGGAWTVTDGRLAFTDDNRAGELFLLDVESSAVSQLTSSGHRYADMRFTPDGEWLVGVREVHDADDPVAVENTLVAVRTDGTDERVVHSGHDFYSSPAFGSSGRITFIAWDHPDMPWDRTTLYVGTFADGAADVAAVPSGDESIVAPGFDPDGRLLAVTDRSDWWNLVEIDPVTGTQSARVSGSFECASPGWVFGLSSWVDTPAGPVVVVAASDGDEIRFPNGQVEWRRST